MAIANTTQILIDTNKRTVVRRIGVLDSDEQLTVFINPTTLSGCLNANGQPYVPGDTLPTNFANNCITVSRAVCSVDAECGHLQLVWQGSTSASFYALGVGSIDTNPQYQFPVITNNAVNPTGNIAIKTVGTTANAAYTVILELHKDSRYFSAGQFQDPGAFNYSPYNLKP